MMEHIIANCLLVQVDDSTLRLTVADDDELMYLLYFEESDMCQRFKSGLITFSDEFGPLTSEAIKAFIFENPMQLHYRYVGETTGVSGTV